MANDSVVLPLHRLGNVSIDSVRCATLNLKGVSDAWLEGRADAVIEALRHRRIDILCLQETTIHYGSEIYDQAQHVGAAIGLNYCVFSPYGNPIEVMSSDQGGIAIVSRWPVRATRNRRLPPGHDRPPDARVALVAMVETPFGPLRVVTTHLSWMPEESSIRLVQTGLLIDELQRGGCLDPGARTVLTGDFNATEDEPAIQLAAEKLQDAFRVCRGERDPGYTWIHGAPMTGGWNMPSRRLDYIFCSRGATVSDVELIGPKEGGPPISDHQGVLAELRFAA